MPSELTVVLERLDDVLTAARRVCERAHHAAERLEPGEESLLSIQLEAAVESLTDARCWLLRAGAARARETIP
jgi:hypothetical protein